MSGRDVEDVVGADLEDRSVVHLDMEPPFEHHAGVVGLAALGCSLIAAQPPPAEGAMGSGLEYVPRDGGVTDLNHVQGEPLELEALVWAIQVFFLGTGHLQPSR